MLRLSQKFINKFLECKFIFLINKISYKKISLGNNFCKIFSDLSSDKWSGSRGRTGKLAGFGADSPE